MPAENAAEMYLPHFVVKQKLTMMINRYEVSESDAAGNPTRLMALAEQKRMAFKEQVTFYSDASKSRVSGPWLYAGMPTRSDDASPSTITQSRSRSSRA